MTPLGSDEKERYIYSSVSSLPCELIILDSLYTVIADCTRALEGYRCGIVANVTDKKDMRITRGNRAVIGPIKPT